MVVPGVTVQQEGLRKVKYSTAPKERENVYKVMVKGKGVRDNDRVGKGMIRKEEKDNKERKGKEEIE